MEFLGKQYSWHPKNSHFVQQIIENFLYRTFSIVGTIWWAFLEKTNILTPCYNSERCIYLIFPQILLSFILNLVSFKFLTTILQVPPWEVLWYCTAIFRKRQRIVKNYLLSRFHFSFVSSSPIPHQQVTGRSLWDCSWGLREWAM